MVLGTWTNLWHKYHYYVYFTVPKYHTFLTPLSINEHIGYLQNSTIMNYIAINMIINASCNIISLIFKRRLEGNRWIEWNF